MNLCQQESFTVTTPSAPTLDRTAGQLLTTPLAPPLSGEDQARAELLEALASSDPILAQGGELALEQAWEQLTLASAVMDPQAVADEFGQLFISIGSPPVNPYGSRYLSGYINDAPLAELRADLARLKLARVRGVGEFEDHLGALCETMRVLVAGGPGIARQPVAEQKRFFEAHLAPWYERAVADIAGAEGANYYRLVARLAGTFLAIEAEAFVVGEETHD